MVKIIPIRSIKNANRFGKWIIIFDNGYQKRIRISDAILENKYCIKNASI